MFLTGSIIIEGMTLTATVRLPAVHATTKGVSFCPTLGDKGKWRAYRTVNGKNNHLGYYETKDEAREAVRQGRNLSAGQRTDRDGVFAVQRRGVTMWRSTLARAAGRRLILGEYMTKGAAILVRDVVARRSGGTPVVADYEMPLAYVSNAVARSYIREHVKPATPLELAEYERRVAILSAEETVTKPAAPRLDMLPVEMWRLRQPSVTGHRA